MARSRARRPDPQRSWYHLDPTADLGQAHLCRSRRFRNRNLVDRIDRRQGRPRLVRRRTLGPPCRRPLFLASYPCHHASTGPLTEGRMRMNASLISLLTGAAVAGVLAVAGWSFAAPSSGAVFADKRPNAVPVDVELVLAVDVSYSMDPEEQALQREGYITGITSRDFMQALRGGQHGKVALTYFEWAGPYDQKIVVPWRLIDGPESADAFANEVARAPYRRASRTSISGALNFAKPLFDASGYGGFRRVIAVSGDGANNSGPFVTIARDDVLAAGLTINGLPIMLKRPNSFTMDVENLDVYYEDCVIGGPGAFVIPIRERDQFKEATRTKLVLEIAGRRPERRVVPVQGRTPRVSCTIGEQMWRGGGGEHNRSPK